jgi:hypothetical protein
MRRVGYPWFKQRGGDNGNWLAVVDEPPVEGLAVQRRALEDEEPLVREHATWSMHRKT